MSLLKTDQLMYFDQLLVAARQVHVVYFDQLLGAAHYIHFISNHNNPVAQQVLKPVLTKISSPAIKLSKKPDCKKFKIETNMPLLYCG